MSSHPNTPFRASTPARAANNLFVLILGAIALPGAGITLFYHPLTGAWIRHKLTQSPSNDGFQNELPLTPSDPSSPSERESNPSPHERSGPPIDSTTTSSPERLVSTPSPDFESQPVTIPPTETTPVRTASQLPVLRIQTRFGAIDGIPIARFSDEVWVLQKNGAIQQTPVKEITNELVLEKAFAPAPVSEMATNLRQEFGAGFQVRWEQPYLFVTRTNGSAFWGEKFRSLQASMKQFCRNYGLATRELTFPLVAVILGSQLEFQQYCRTHGIAVPETCVGIYSQKSNRIVLFDTPKSGESQHTVDTICHEAAHQLAFNYGLHQRCAATPLWLAEGFATMFEAPRYAEPTNVHLSPWPSERKVACKRLAKEPAQTKRILESLLRNDNPFEQSPDDAYALAWGLTHFLSTTHPKNFAQYLRCVGQLEPFGESGAAVRWEMFQQSFGSDTTKLTLALTKHLESLR
ncbi:hypothetical protein VN12_18305 [Pirellula sp. SH-Sr6A]|uniref:DUF1570 domain-containing protein n=1 Tax=Pirellula sp. SH-Sr6A TaxID=1632865 RepID=UPI00078D2BBC|nr:DUF1570 domain-containing protein [Pirellula sp. SH-Sr6A]AMV34089.1 hypothetical protein VN12_18305 [Pirellula sp. SH-Sr6A]